MCYLYAEHIHAILKEPIATQTSMNSEIFQQLVMNYITGVVGNLLGLESVMLHDYYQNTGRLWLVVSVPIRITGHPKQEVQFVMDQRLQLLPLFKELGFSVENYSYRLDDNLLQLSLREF